MSAPSGWSIQTAMSIAQSTVARLEQAGIATDEADLLALLRDEGADVETLLLRLLRAASEAEAFADATALRMKDLADRKARYTRQHDAYRGAAFAMIEALPEVFPGRKFRHPEFTATVQNGRLGAVITDETAVPEEFWRTTRALAMSDINAAVKAGQVIPGVEVSNGQPSITIRSK